MIKEEHMYYSMYPWNWADGHSRVAFSPRSSSTSSQEADSLEGEPTGVIRDHNKRGRPRAEKISSLILEGALSTNSIRCRICSRVFPREKSLQAHMRTHTGERPYLCDFPGCCKSFCQSGQLKTHQRLHTGEKPFACSIEGCDSQFTHANRHCTDHPYASLRRVSTQEQLKSRMGAIKASTNQSVSEWLTRHCMQRDDLDAVAPTQPEKKLKRESSLLPPATSIVHVQHIEVTPRNEPEDVPMPLITHRTAANISSASSFSSSLSYASSMTSSVPSTTSFPSIVTPPNQYTSSVPSPMPAPLTALNLTVTGNSNTTSSAMATERPPKPVVSPSKTFCKSGHRPFKKEATDKWVSALALLELAQGVS